MWSKDEALNVPSSDGVRELVLLDSVWKLVVETLYAHGLAIFRIPLDDEEGIPSYAITFPLPKRG